MIGDATVEPLPVFVYGTLLEGQPNAFVWHNNTISVAAAVCRGARLFDCGIFPIMFDAPGYSVMGQVYHVKPRRFPALIQALDLMEGFDPLAPSASTFRRERREVIVNGGDAVICWTYIGGGDSASQNLPAVPAGDWLHYIASRSR